MIKATLFLIILVMISQGVIAQDSAPVIVVKEIIVSDSTVEIKWETSEPSRSTLTLNDNSEEFPISDSFIYQRDNLVSGETYLYSIQACNNQDSCALFKDRFATTVTTKIDSSNRLTGAATTDVTGLGSIQNLVSLVFYLLLGAVIAGVVYSTVSRRVNKDSREVESMLSNVELLIKDNHQEQALSNYEQARKGFDNLSPKEQDKHKERLVKAYQKLKEYALQQEAHSLMDKYMDGDITKEEIERLREILSE